MKRLVILLIGMVCSFSVFATNPDSKTFLVLFKSKDLKDTKTSIKEIEDQFSFAFPTKSYEGNSELALVIEIPIGNFDKHFLGEFLISLKNGQKIQLQQLAFRLVDLSESKALYQQYMAIYEETHTPKKKPAKSTRATPNP
jgi:hypothetical protein